MTTQTLKTPIPIRGLSFSPPNPETLEAAAELIRTLALSMGMTDTELVPLRCDNNGVLQTRPVDCSKVTCVSGSLVETTEVDLGDVYDYVECFCYQSWGYLDVGLVTGVYPIRVMPNSIASAYNGVAVIVGASTFRFYGQCRFLYFTAVGTSTNDGLYTAYKFAAR